jgi:hypothetical protein
MRINKLIIVISTCFIVGHATAQSEQSEKYRKFAVYAGVGPSFFFNNLQLFSENVKPWQYAFSARFMWEPEHSFLSLGIETGYFKLYSVSDTISNAQGQVSNAHVTNASVPIMFVVSMKFSKKVYANWGMGQSVTFNKVSASGVNTNHDATTWSLSDFTATVGYRFVQKPRLSYAAEFKGYYSSGYQNATIALLFIVGFRL